jgi:serine-type D-Ala-D-Ala carboxypeptidase
MLLPGAFDPLLAFMKANTPGVFPAAVVMVAQGGKTVFHQACGFLDPDKNERPAQLETLFDLASLTKLFTAVAFMRLVEVGHTGLDEPVGQVIPEFSGIRAVGPGEDPILKIATPPEARFAGYPVNLDSITFRQLLTHTAGLAPWRSIFQVGGNPVPTPLPHQVRPEVRGRRIAAVSTYDFASPPGVHILYSDLGFILLGEALARLEGKDLESCLQDLIFEPLGLHNTVFNPLAKGFSPNGIAPTEVCAWRGRRLLGEVDDENAAGLGGVSGHAGLFSTAREVAKLGQLFLPSGGSTARHILQPATLVEMGREHAALEGLRRGLAWMLWTPENCSCGSRFGPNSFGHTGFTGTSLWIDPDRELLVAALTNRVYYGRDPGGIQAFRPRLHDLIAHIISEEG